MIKQIPNLITLGNLACGFISLTCIDIKYAVLWIIVGAILDIFDGAVARLLKVDGALGVQLDSLADMVTFGIAPAFLWHKLANSADFYLVIIALCLFVGGAAFRLGKFNLLPPSKLFKGLPSPSSGLLLAGMAFASQFENSIATTLLNFKPLFYLLPIILAIMMNVRWTFFSFKSLDKEFRSQWPLIVVGLAIFFMIIYSWADTLWFGIAIYIIISLVIQRQLNS